MEKERDRSPGAARANGTGRVWNFLRLFRFHALRTADRPRSVQVARLWQHALKSELRSQICAPEDSELRTQASATASVNAGSPGHLVANWPDSARADRYRVYKQVIGVDDEFVLAATVEDSDADLNTFASGAQVRVRVASVNEAGESLPSQIVEQQVP